MCSKWSPVFWVFNIYAIAVLFIAVEECMEKQPERMHFDFKRELTVGKWKMYCNYKIYITYFVYPDIHFVSIYMELTRLNAPVISVSRMFLVRIIVVKVSPNVLHHSLINS